MVWVNLGDNTALQEEIASLSKENDELRREKEQKALLVKKVEELQEERDQDKVTIAYPESEQRRSVVPTTPNSTAP